MYCTVVWSSGLLKFHIRAARSVHGMADMALALAPTHSWNMELTARDSTYLEKLQ